MILWIDDDSKLILKPFIEELKDEKYEVRLASNPDCMWDILKKNNQHIELIIMDIMLPVGDDMSSEETKMGCITGFLLLKKLKSMEEYSNIPMLIFTIKTDPDVQAWARDNDIKYLKKQDVYPVELMKNIHSILEK